ncbi:MAG: TetR/AcrR family transcriptional regulator [Anaerolineales bacterium]
MDNTLDRRVRRTRRDLTAALIRLTSERPYATIQVRDITDEADVGYATFYRHYQSKDDLMLAVFDKITGELETSAVEKGGEYFVQEGQLLFGHVQKYRGLYRSILQSPDFVSSRSCSSSGLKVTSNVTQSNWVIWHFQLNWQPITWCPGSLD